jgi:hypothetical protein
MSRIIHKPPSDNAAPAPMPASDKQPVTREMLEALGHKVIEPKGEGFMIIPVGKPSPK